MRNFPFGRGFLLMATMIFSVGVSEAKEKKSPSKESTREMKWAQKMLKGPRHLVQNSHVMEICKDLTLTELDLSDCGRVTSECLKDMSQLGSLEMLNLNKARHFKFQEVIDFAGNLPKLTSLKYADAFDYSLTSIEGFRHLKHLDLAHRRGKIRNYHLEFFSSLTKLTHLNLNQSRNYHDNKLSDKGIKHLETLTNLEFLGLYGGHDITDEGYTQLFKKLKKLKYLEMGFNWKHKGKELELPEGLVHLDLADSFNLLDDAIVNIKNKQTLRFLNLFYCLVLTDKTLEALRDLNKLEDLNVGGIRSLTDEGLKCLENNIGLKILCINDNDNFSDNGLLHLKKMTKIEKLDLWHLPSIKGDGLVCTKDMMKLKSINLADCFALTDEGLKHLQDKTMLEELYLNSCKELTDKGVGYLKNLSSLKELTLTACPKITDKGLEFLKNLKSLNYLDLSYCEGLSRSAIRALKKALPQCKIVS